MTERPLHLNEPLYRSHVTANPDKQRGKKEVQPSTWECDEEEDEIPVIVIRPSSTSHSGETPECPPAVSADPATDEPYSEHINPGLHFSDTGNSESVEIIQSQPEEAELTASAAPSNLPPPMSTLTGVEPDTVPDSDGPQTSDEEPPTSDDPTPSDDPPVSDSAPHRPTRSRHPPSMLTYDTLGTPSCQPAVMNAVQVPGTAPVLLQQQFPQQPLQQFPQQFLQQFPQQFYPGYPGQPFWQYPPQRQFQT